MKCHGCASEAVIVYRIVPHQASRSLFDTTPRDIASCKDHIQAAKAIGTRLSATPLSDEISTRIVKEGPS